MSRIDNNVFVTKNGHICEKSKKGKRRGTAIGAIAGTTYIAAEAFLPRNHAFYRSIGAKNDFQAYTKFIKNENYIFSEMMRNGFDRIGTGVAARMSKFGRFAFVAGSALAVIGLTTLIGRGIGKIADKVTNKRHAEQADAQ